MLTAFSIFSLFLLAACTIAAAWPILHLRRFRPALVGTAGSCCVATGASVFALLVSGLIPVTGFMQQALAQEDAPATSSAPGSSAPSSTPALPTSPSPSSDPVLEVPPTTEVVIPSGRPSWVDAEPNLDGEVHHIAVSSGPYKRHSDAVSALDEQLHKQTQRYIGDLIGSPLAAKFVGISTWKRPGYDAHVKPENRYEETIISPTLGPMHQVHALLEFDAADRQGIKQAWDHFRATSRLTQLGLFAGAGLLLIGSIFSYFRLDTTTRGYYTGRLQFMTAAAILAVIGGGLFAARWIHWL